MKYEDLMDYFKSKRAIANAIDVSVQAVHTWWEKGKIPKGRQFQFEIITEGKLKADRNAGLYKFNIPKDE
jgi:transcriptional repressor of cell division inhibition gene dicB